jgi:hypothetical protein
MDGRPCGPTLLPPVAVAVAVPSAIPSHRFALPRAGSPATCLSSFCPLDSAPRFKTRRGLAFRDNVVIRVGFRGRLAAAFCLFFFLHAENCARNRFRPRARASDPSSSVMCAQFTCSRDYSRGRYMLGCAETDGAGSREAFLAHYHLRGFVCLASSLKRQSANRVFRALRRAQISRSPAPVPFQSVIDRSGLRLPDLCFPSWVI